MKKQLLGIAAIALFLVALSGGLFAQGIWEVASQPTINATLYTVEFLDDGLHGWLGGYGGVIYFTEDGGTTWQVQNSGVSKSIESIKFLTDSLGFAASYDGNILRTSDGGTTWEKIPNANTTALYGMSVVDSSHLWAVGKAGTILFCNGDTVVTQASNTTKYLYGVSFYDTLNGIAVGKTQTVLFTKDGGATWTAASSVPAAEDKDFNAVQMMNDSTAWLVGDGFGAGIILKSIFMKTTDGGDTWTLYDSDTYKNMWSVDFYDESHGAAVGDHGVVYTTDDGGTTWTLKPYGFGFTAKSVKKIGDNLWVAGYDGSIMKSTDNGDTWSYLAKNAPALYSMAFASKTNGMAVGFYGMCYQTTNGGYSWEPYNLILDNDPRSLQAIDFANADTGWVVGRYGLIGKTMDGGETWVSQKDTAITKSLYSVFAMNDTTVWAGGYNGILYQSNDGGSSWTEMNTGLPAKTIYAIYFADDTAGCIGGKDSTLYYTTDGGATWNKSHTSIGAKKTINDIFFPDSQHGWAVADGGYILATSDSGKTWTVNAQPTTKNLYSILMVSPTQGWAAGYNGLVFYTDDGGTTWTQLAVGTSKSIKEMALRNNAMLFTAGYSGIIMKAVREDYVAHSNIKINELYVGGPQNDNYFFKDQYVELYNAGTETEYLDGKIICRLAGNITKVTYIFQFPGNGTDYPIQPGEYKVCAQSAVNWKNQMPTSIDLSHADFEFYNPASPSDPDNPDVPNIVNLYAGRHTDFMLSLTSDEVILASGADVDYTDGIDFETVIDGVEYDGKPTTSVTLDPRISADHFCCAVKYQGKSIERIAPGYDTNNSATDFRLIDYPTPGLTMPVELASFTAAVSEKGITLSWITASETNNLGFEIQRSLDEKTFQKVGFVKGNGTSTKSHAYSFVDESAHGNTYYYRLKQVDLDGTFELSKILTVNGAIPLRYALEQNYPNPFNPRTSITFQLKKDGKVTLKIYNAVGQCAATLVDGKKMKAGSHNISWNAANFPSGLYFYKISVNDFQSVKKMLLVK